MTEASIETLKATVFVERKISDNKFGSHSFGIHLPVELTPDTPVGEQSDAVLAAFEQAKAIIATQSEPILAAVVEASFASPAPASGGRTAPARSSNDSATVEYFCEADGKVTSHFDNRADITSGKAKPKSPKLKCKVCRKGVWDLVDENFATAPLASVPANEQEAF